MSATPGLASSVSSDSVDDGIERIRPFSSKAPKPKQKNTKSPPAPVIWINGFPGTGKREIAIELRHLIGIDRAILIQNHRRIDNVALPRRHSQAWKEGALDRKRTLMSNVLAPHMRHKTIIFTDFQTDSLERTDNPIDYLEAAHKANRPFLPVTVMCSESENIRRATDPVRCWPESSVQRKVLKNAFVLRCYRTLKLFDFDEVDYFHEVKRDGLVIDATELDAVIVAEMIQREVKRSRKGKEAMREVGSRW
ncbi:AAA domain-containing protein [Colletotrichum asianum]